eukprot:scaffold2009_cov370-Prasinococcus_capsulatus_cf.AAC.3
MDRGGVYILQMSNPCHEPFPCRRVAELAGMDWPEQLTASAGPVQRVAWRSPAADGQVPTQFQTTPKTKF